MTELALVVSEIFWIVVMIVGVLIGLFMATSACDEYDPDLPRGFCWGVLWSIIMMMGAIVLTGMP